MNLHRLQQLGILTFSILCLAPVAGHAASYAPLDCAEASTAAEAAVCKTYMLGQDEARLATLFGVLTSLVAMGQRSDLIDAQRKWISTREACGGNVDCLSKAYETRIDELLQALDTLAKRGPF